MIEELKAAGFLAVETEGTILHARLWASSVDFTATPKGAQWRLAVQWPLRATQAQLAEWNAAHPEAAMDIHLGETRVAVLIPDSSAGSLQDRLHDWAAIAEEAVAQMIRWRRVQRAPGEGY